MTKKKGMIIASLPDADVDEAMRKNLEREEIKKGTKTDNNIHDETLQKNISIKKKRNYV